MPAVVGLARRVLERADTVATFSEEPGKITRPLASRSLQRATACVAGWMEEAGMTTRTDAIGNLIGRWVPAAQSASPPPATEPAATLIVGSHLDSVADAGRYDGVLGILVGIALVKDLSQRGIELPYAIELVAFADEEGLRFQSTLLGSRAFLGAVQSSELALRDVDGVTLADAISAAGGDPDALLAPARDPQDLLGYFEVHIEQGPVLEKLDLPLGVVTAIAGQSRFNVTFQGHAGHAGTTPMDLRRDALAAAAEFVLGAERLAQSETGLVATVGELSVPDGACNVIPGRVHATLDIRHQSDPVRARAITTLREEVARISERRGVSVSWDTIAEHPATPCDPDLRALVAEAVGQAGVSVHELPSGAGHDAVALAAVTPAAMLFVRCAGGVSHHPDEAVKLDDVAAAIDAGSRLLQLLARRVAEKRDAGAAAETTR